MDHYPHVSKINNQKIREVVKVRSKTQVQLLPSQGPVLQSAFVYIHILNLPCEYLTIIVWANFCNLLYP